VAGLGGALFGALIAFANVAIRGCDHPVEQGSTFVCDHLAALVPWVGTALAAIAILAPLCGGLASCITGRARWLGFGAATCAATCAAMAVLGGDLLLTYSFN
jgi:hypothetical protein